MRLASCEDCTGCGACASVCTKKCIQMKLGANGFFYPHISSKNCVECGLCTKNCHILYELDIPQFNKVYYQGWDPSETKRLEGSSGGAFGALAESILSFGGVVYGAAFSADKKTLSHQSTHNVRLVELKKSKYIESGMNLTIKHIHQDLANGLSVLFCGTPCQVYGIRRVFGDKYENLILCDFLCHGVPSQMRYQQYLKELEDKYSSVVKEIGFRTKKYGWRTYCIVVDFENGKQYVKLANEDPYYKHYFQNINYRPSCYRCNRVKDSAADITLGDFWGVRKAGYYDDDKGISLIICNTEKGKQTVDSLKAFELRAIEAEDVAYAFTKRYLEKKETSLTKSFFDGFRMTFKDMLLCMSLRNSLLRKIIYRLV